MAPRAPAGDEQPRHASARRRQPQVRLVGAGVCPPG